MIPNRPALNDICFRVACNEDLMLIAQKAVEWKLDDENLRAEDFLIAENETTGEVAGFGRIKKYFSFWELATVGVVPEKRNQGLGRTIVHQLIERFPSKQIWITTDLIEYFQKFGFVMVQDGPKELADKISRCHCRQNRPGVKIMLFEKS